MREVARVVAVTWMPYRRLLASIRLMIFASACITVKCSLLPNRKTKNRQRKSFNASFVESLPAKPSRRCVRRR